MNFCKKCTAKPYSFLVIDATLVSDHKRSKQLMKRLVMKNYNMILTEKQQKYQLYHLKNLKKPSEKKPSEKTF